ncbi:MAG: AsmA family protein, partial [Pseudomonadota bacterium]
GSLRASVKLLPLLFGRVEIAQVTLENPTVRLERLADGRANWDFGESAEAPAEEAPPSSGGAFNTGIDRAALTNAAVYYRDWTTDTQYALTNFSASARMTALDQPFTSQGDGALNGQDFDYRIELNSIAGLMATQPSTLDIALNTIYGEVAFDGAVTLAETPILDGRFDVASETIGAALSLLGGLDLPIDVTAIQSVQASGAVSGPATSAELNFSTLALRATGVAVDYQGGITLGDAPRLDGQVTLNAEDAQRLLLSGDPLIPILTLLGDVDLTATLSGPLATPTLTDIVLKQRGPDLTTDYSGNIRLDGEQSLGGALAMSSDNLRGLLAALDTEMPEGDSLNAFDLRGDIDGTLLTPSLTGATFVLDDTTATGRVGADLTGTRPRVVADLSTDQLDLTPFLGSGSQQEDTEPSLNEDWDDTPLDLAGLKAIDASIAVAAQSVIIDQITLNDAVLNTQLDNGRLSARFRQDDNQPGFRVFQGNWSGDFVLDASGTVPTLEVEALADSIAAQEMLTALTGFQNLSGLGDVQLDLASEGNSLKALISGLDGSFESDLNRGAIKGLNLAKLVRDASNLTDLLGSGQLSVTSFREAFSPEAETDFSNFIGNLSFTNGVASITDLQIDNPVVGITGAGSIDLGARTLDIRLTPRVDVNAAGAGATLGLANIPIPVRVYGSWASVQFGLDSSAVQAELTARLRQEAASELTNRLAGDAGSLLGQIVGGNGGADRETDSNDEPTSLEDELTSRALGALFGNSGERDPPE